METTYKYFSLKFFYMVVLVLFLGRPATFFSNLDPRFNPIGFSIYFLPCLYFYYKYGLHLSKKFLVLLGVYTAWVFVHLIIDKETKILPYLLLYIHLYVAYVTVRVYRTDIFGYFWRIVVGLTFVDSILWLGVNCIDMEKLSSYSILTPAASCSSASFIIFNVPHFPQYEGLGLFGLIRNCGFAWEPGLYGSIIIFAMFFNLAEKEYKIIGNTSLYILCFGVFSTFSTTAYSALIALFALHLFWGLFNKFSAKYLGGIIALLLLILLVNNLPFMAEKIETDINLENSITEDISALSTIESEREYITVSRSEGVYLDYLNLQESPVWGYGFNRENSYVSKNISQYIITSNDLTSFMAIWGGIYTFIIIMYMIWNSRFLRCHILQDDNSLFSIYLILSFSYSFSTCALTIAFLFYRIFDVYTNLEDDIEDYAREYQ